MLEKNNITVENQSPALPDHAWIEAHIPHQGTMCLIDQVSAWDNLSIRCKASSHRSLDNPLRARNQLGAAVGIEYAAQAMAIHGALQVPAGSAPARVGFLLSVRGASLHRLRLDDIADDLDIEAHCVHSSGDNILYEFTLQAAGQLLLNGRATVLLNSDFTLGASI